MVPNHISPSNDFTKKVMTEVKKRPRKIGFWNLIYFAPIIIAVMMVTIPSTQQFLLNLTSNQHVAVDSVQKDIDDMYVIMDELTQFEFDSETQAIAEVADE